MKRTIKKVAVLGSGIMGSRIACHFAGIGLPVILLDIVPQEAKDSRINSQRNKLVNDALNATIKSNPSPVFTKDVVKNITTGNFDDDLNRISDCDWIIEVVVEKLEIKKSLYEKVEQFRKTGTLITSNTSGIPIGLLAEGRSDDFKQNFCGTHFFNPPRYLRLLEIIPTPDTSKEVIDFLLHYGDLYLGKTTVLAKDTPAFIANRIGVFSIMAIFKLMDQLSLNIDEIDLLTGPVIGRPKSATFRTTDVVGIDTLVKVAQGVAQNCPDDEAAAIFSIPQWLQQMVENKWLGEKTAQGFFKVVRKGGNKEILTLNLNTFEYLPRVKPRFLSVETARPIDDFDTRIKMLFNASDKAGAFYRLFHFHLFSYISFRIPEISDELYRIDDAMKAGFGWEMGPFESWDLLGVSKVIEMMKAAGFTIASWVEEFVANGNNTFYKNENGVRYYYDVLSKSYKSLPGANAFLVMSQKKESIVWKNSVATVYDLGEDVLGYQWNTKMNTIGGEVLEGLTKAVQLAEQNYKGLVVANEGVNFSAGANVGMIFMLAVEQEFEELDLAVRMFQNTMMRMRYSSIPVVVAPHGMSLGGSCEMALHADKIQAAAETYIGLVEMGVGIIPAGGGTKEFALRASDEYHEGEIEMEPLKRRFFTIGTAKVAMSAHESFDLGIMRHGIDEISMNVDRRIADAKRSVLEIWADGYVIPVKRNDIKVLGRGALGALYAGINGMMMGHYITEHDVKIAKKLAYVMCGGDLSEATIVSEKYLLDLEREAFLSLCGERKTLERLQSVLKGGKPIRN